MDVKGEAAIVTGGASGLGRATAEALVAAGARVALIDRNADLVAATAQEIGALAASAELGRVALTRLGRALTRCFLRLSAYSDKDTSSPIWGIDVINA